MKKYLMILLVGIISFLKIDSVNAVEFKSYKSDTCVLYNQTGNSCDYHCKVTDGGDNFFEFDYNVNNVAGIKANMNNLVTGGSDCSIFPDPVSRDYNGNNATSYNCIKYSSDPLGNKITYYYEGIYLMDTVIEGNFYSDKGFRCPSVYADVNVDFSAVGGGSRNPQNQAGYFTYTFSISILKDETQIEEDAKDFLENENTDQCSIFGENLTPYIKSGIKIIRILVAVIFAVMTIIDFLKVVMTGEDKSYKEATSKFIKRLIIVILIEVLPILISLLIDISGILQNYNIQGDIYCSLF